MKIEELKADLEKGDIIYKGNCHDCDTPVTVTAKVAEDGVIIIDGGAVYKIEKGIAAFYFKCDKCYEKDHTLTDWQDCEVYSRVVGYYRPVKQWNKGKKAEWAHRREFKNPED